MLVVDLHILWKDKLKQWKFWTRNSFKYIEVSVTSDNKIRFVFRTWYLMVQEVVAEDFFFLLLFFFKICFVFFSWYLMVQEVVAEDFYFFFIIFF